MAYDRKRPIFITERNMERLQDLVDILGPASENDLENFERLEEELYRANIVEPENIPLEVVTINSKVQLREMDSDLEIIIILVFPSDANLSEHKISILAPIGSAVIGRQTGDIIEWKAPRGIKRAKIEKMLYQPEAAEKSKL